MTKILDVTIQKSKLRRIVIKAPEGCNAFNKEQHLHGKGNKNEVGYTNSGWLNLYALGCGYMERMEIEDGRYWVTLWGESSGEFQVRAHDFTNQERICWEAFDTVKEAREFFAKKVEELRTTTDGKK